MPAPHFLRSVYHAFQETYGPEDSGYVFPGGPDPIGRLDVLVYRPDPRDVMTSFVTVGLSIEPMPVGDTSGRAHRAELRLVRRGAVSEAEEAAIARQLANIAAHPWTTGNQLDWGQTLGVDTEFPAFPGCRSVFLAGPHQAEMLDYLYIHTVGVRIINVVPLTDGERARARTMRPFDFVTELMAEVDVFTGRSGMTAD